MKRIWARVGMTYEVMDDDYKMLEDAISQNNLDLVCVILSNSKHYENGESYLPAGVDYNPNLTEDFGF